MMRTPAEHIPRSFTLTLTFIVPALISWGCASSTVDQVFVRVPSKAQLDLNKYDTIFLADFLNYTNLQGVYKDRYTDFGKETQAIVRNELRNYLSTSIVQLNVANLPANDSPPSSLAMEIPLKPDIDFWNSNDNVSKWAASYVVPLIRRPDFEVKRPAIIFGVVEVEAYDRTAEETPNPSARYQGVRSQNLPAGMKKIEVRVGLHFYLLDGQDLAPIFVEYRQHSTIVPNDDTLRLSTYYNLLDRIMPRILSAVVPIYMDTQRAIYRRLPGGKAS